MSALVLRIVFPCFFPFFTSFLLFCVSLPPSRFFHSHYFLLQQRTQSCSYLLMSSVYTWGQASKPVSEAKLYILPLPFSYPLPHQDSCLPFPGFSPVFPCSCMAAVPYSWHIWLGPAWVLSMALMQSSCWTPDQSLTSPLWCLLSISTTLFPGKGTVCYSLSLSTIAQHSSLWFKAPYTSLILTVILMCLHISLDSVYPSSPSSPPLFTILLLFYCSLPSFLASWSSFFFPTLSLPFPSPCCQALGSCPGLEMRLGTGNSKDLPGRVESLWPLSLQREWGFLCLILIRQGNKEKEEAEQFNELSRGNMAFRKTCVCNGEQTLLEEVFNIWLAKPCSLEVYRHFITFPGFHFHLCPNLGGFLFIIFSSLIQHFFLPLPSPWPMGCFTPTNALKIPWLGCSSEATINSCICNLFIIFYIVLQQVSGEGYKRWMQVNNTGVCGKLH